MSIYKICNILKILITQFIIYILNKQGRGFMVRVNYQIIQMVIYFGGNDYA